MHKSILKDDIYDMNSLNVDLLVKHVKSIIDNSRCVSCDYLQGPRVRYPCGHSVCNNCVVNAEDCLLCFSPPSVSTHVIDGPLTLHVEHVSKLLHTFQDLFKLDVYRRQRISDQLNLEKQLFPECIQATSKYSNIKRLSNTKNIENIKSTLFPGENTSKPNIFKMENKMNYVQQWLSNNETSLKESKYNLPRKPFTDLNVNAQNVTKTKIPKKGMKRKKNPSKSKVHFKSDNHNKPKLSLTRKITDGFVNKKKIKHNDESGIFIEEEVVVINDTSTLDKDKEAWLAVIEADKNIPCDISVSNLSKTSKQKDINTNNIDKAVAYQNDVSIYKVPFYQKSSLLKTKCYDQIYENSIKNNVTQNASNSDNVTITIDNNMFVTTIKLSEVTDRAKYSVGVQTECENKLTSDISKIVKPKLQVKENSELIKKNNTITTLGMTKTISTESGDPIKEITLLETNQKLANQSVRKAKCVIIDESDSDSDYLPNENNGLLEITAEVHRSETENVLFELKEGEYEHRTKHAIRGHTPVSTDSSDKENYDPNRVKRRKLDKKCCSKKI